MRADAFVTPTRAGLLGLVLVTSAGLLGACEEFDPVRTEDLCTDRGTISMRCPACQMQPYAEQCSICRKKDGPEKDNPSICRPATSPATKPDSGVDPGPDASPTSGEGGGGAGATGTSGVGGGAGTRIAGRGGMSGSMAGAGARPPSPSGCSSDLECKSSDSNNPACDMQTKACVECTKNADCSGARPACDETQMVCVECDSDSQCTDEVKNACDTSTHTCVDCMTSSYCSGVLGTCDTTRRTCVDCLGNVGDCDEDGKRACDLDQQVCVQCLSNDHCKDSVLGTCDKPRQLCVDCMDDAGCAGGTHCDTERQVCVQCRNGAQCTSGHCVEQKCVECERDQDCGTAGASHCDTESHECVGCASNTHCAHLSQTRACDTENERCVECNDDSTCNGKACIRAEHECSGVNVNSLSVCLACEADSQCMTNMKCVELRFASQPYGKFCVFTRASRGNSCTAARPYTQPLTNAQSVDGTTTNYCVPFMRTTCPGVLDVALGASGMSCNINADCGIGNGDALCSDGKCTYSCGAATDCPAGLDCTAGGICG